ncbi:MAG: hypothetical protein ACXVCP_14820 [Bdellovibrio sp.]
MKLLTVIVANLVLLSGIQANAFLSCKKNDEIIVQLATDVYNRSVELNKRGLIKFNTVLRKHIFAYEAQFCSGAITAENFCNAVMPLINELDGTNIDNAELKVTLLAEARVLCD